jgi:hypothetical protein
LTFVKANASTNLDCTAFLPVFLLQMFFTSPILPSAVSCHPIFFTFAFLPAQLAAINGWAASLFHNEVLN